MSKLWKIILGWFGFGKKKEDVEPVEELPFSWGDVKWVSGDGDISNWDQTITITGMNIGSTIAWSYDSPSLERIKNWRRTNSISNHPNACIGFVVEHDGGWYGAIGEWLLPGQMQQAKKVLKSDRGNKKMFSSPLRDYEPKDGTEFHMFVCGLNWSGQSNTRERSNIVTVKYS